MVMNYTRQRELEVKTVSRSGISPNNNNNMTTNHPNPSCKIDRDIHRLQWELKEIRMKSKQCQRLRIEEQRKAKRQYQLKHQQYHLQLWRACTSTTTAGSIGNAIDASRPCRHNQFDDNNHKNGFLRHNFNVYSNFLQQEIFPQHQYEVTPSKGSRNQITTMATAMSSRSSRTILALTTEVLRSLHGVAISSHQLELLEKEWNTLQRWSSQTSGREKDMKTLVESRLLSRIENMWAETSFIQRNASPVIEEQRQEIHKLNQCLWRRSLSEGGVEDHSNYSGPPISQKSRPQTRHHRAQASIVTPLSNRKRYFGAFIGLQRSNNSGSDDSMVINRLQKPTLPTHKIITPQKSPKKLVGDPSAKQSVPQEETISKKDSNQSITQSKPQAQQNVLSQEQSLTSCSHTFITKSNSPSFHTWPTFFRRNNSRSIPGSITNTADRFEPGARKPPMPQAPQRRDSSGLSRNNSSRSIPRSPANNANECEFDSTMPPMPQALRRRASDGLFQGALSSNKSVRNVSRIGAGAADKSEFDAEITPLSQNSQRGEVSFCLSQRTFSRNNSNCRMVESTNTSDECDSDSEMASMPQALRRRHSFGLLQPGYSKDARVDQSQEQDHQANSTATNTMLETPNIRSILRRQNGCRTFAAGSNSSRENQCKDDLNCLLDDEDDNTAIVTPACQGTMNERFWLDIRPGFSRQNGVRSVAQNKSGEFEDKDDAVPPLPSAVQPETYFGRLWKSVSNRELLDIGQIEEDMDLNTTCRTTTTAASSSDMASLDTRPSTSSDSIEHCKSDEYEQERDPMPSMPPSPRRNSSLGWLWENINKGEIEEDATVTRTFERPPPSKAPNFLSRISSHNIIQCESDDDESISLMPPSPPRRKSSFGSLWENITTIKDGVTENVQQRKEEEDAHSTSTISSVDTTSATLSLKEFPSPYWYQS